MKSRSILLLLALAAAAALGAAPSRREIAIDVLFTSDVHGHIDRGDATFLNPEFPPPLGGGATAAAYIRGVRDRAAAEGRPVLLFDSGDLFQGTPVGTRTRGSAVIEWMNRMAYDAITLGNHDFDLGADNAARLAAESRAPVLVANLYDRATGQRVSWARDHMIRDVGGARIAVLGYITESTVQMAFEKNIAGLEFRPVIDQIEADVARVRQEGADLVFVLLHHGLPYRTEVETEYRALEARAAKGTLRRPGMDAMELAHVVRGVDAFFSGHTHQGFDRPWQDPETHALVFEPYANGSSLGHVTLRVDAATRTLVGYDTHFDRGALLTLLEDEYWPDSAEAAVIEPQVAEAEQGLDVVLGRTFVMLDRGNGENGLMGFVMADAYREELGAEFAVQNTGGVRADIAPGPITERDLLAVSPFGNQMVLARVPGAMLLGVLEAKATDRGGVFISGGRIRFDPSRPAGSRILSAEIGGEPLDTTRTYRVAMTDYLAEGNSGLGPFATLATEDVQPAGITDREALSRYIRRQGVLAPENDGRWQRVARP